MERTLESRKLMEVGELGVDRNSQCGPGGARVRGMGGGQDREMDPVSAGSVLCGSAHEAFCLGHTRCNPLLSAMLSGARELAASLPRPPLQKQSCSLITRGAVLVGPESEAVGASAGILRRATHRWRAAERRFIPACS